MSEEQKNKKFEQIADRVRLSGVTLNDLLNPQLLTNLKDQGLHIFPFLLVMDINNEAVISLGHHDPSEIESKILYLETPHVHEEKDYNEKAVKYIRAVSDALEKMVE